MKTAYIFPGQGAQYTGMGKELYDSFSGAKKLFEQANEILGFNIAEIMFSGSAEELKQTNVTQPAIFIHSVAAFQLLGTGDPDMVAGHSLGEFSALVANEALQFEDALRLVSIRANAMQRACEQTPSTMAAVLALADEVVEDICAAVQSETGEVVVAANYNCPGQLVISGSIQGIDMACERLKEAGARRALVLPVGGAFHSPLMEPAREELAKAIMATQIQTPKCPIYQNVHALPVMDPALIRQNLIAQLTGAVKWTQTIQNMVSDGATEFIECGPGKVLQGLVQKIHRDAQVSGLDKP